MDLTGQLSTLAIGSRKYLGLTSHDDGRVYVQYDKGAGPEMEEWAVPQTSVQQWTLVGKVNVNLR
jgi:hypothetical protein